MVSSTRWLVVAFVLYGFCSASFANPSLTITGSDTLAPLVTQWLQDFKRSYPHLRVEMQSTGSATVPTALAEGTVDFGVMSRQMTREELSEFKARRGFAPRAIPIARDALVVIVNKTNPITRLSLDEIDRIFSANARCSGQSIIHNWRHFEAPKTDQWLAGPIDVFSRTATSGSYGLFKARVLCNGDFTARAVEFEGFAALVDSVANTSGGIGYTGLQWVNDKVKPLELSVFENTAPSLQSSHPDYPLTRDMFLYWAQPSGVRLSDIHCNFIQYSQSAQAQAMVIKQGLSPIANPSTASQGDNDLCS